MANGRLPAIVTSLNTSKFMWFSKKWPDFPKLEARLPYPGFQDSATTFCSDKHQ